MLESIIKSLSPQWAYKRAVYRHAMAAYEAVKPTRTRKRKGDNRSGNATLDRAGKDIRAWGRHLDQNYDLATGVLNTLVNNTVGPFGLSTEPQPKKRDGTIHDQFARELLKFWHDWMRRPDISWSMSWPAAERLLCRTWFRDGEALIQFFEGVVAGLEHGTMIPFSVELIEADLMPMEYSDVNKNIVQGITFSKFKRPELYHLYDDHPGDARGYLMQSTRAIPADRILHPKIVTRFNQARGVSIFASVLSRIDDLQEYEEAERVAARIAAAITGAIKKGTPDDYAGPADGSEERKFKMSPGMIFDLQPGESVETIQSNRPSALLEPFHTFMQRGISAGTGANFSTISKRYDGNYSAQRQELVEGWPNYQAMTGLFSSQVREPIYQRAMAIGIISGRIKVPRDVDPATVLEAAHRGPAMPWIDPDKESKANERLQRNLHKTGPQILRERGINPDTALEEESNWRRKVRDAELIISSDPANDSMQPMQVDTTNNQEDDANA